LRDHQSIGIAPPKLAWIAEARMSTEDRARELILECIQHLQQHPSLASPMYKYYLSTVCGDGLKKCGITAEQICAE
jgi:hypothetical protein